MTEKEVIDFPYTIKAMVLTKSCMDMIELPHQRKIRQTQVNSVLNCLRNGEHFESPFVINVNNGTRKLRVIDGGHRVSALNEWFKEEPDGRINVEMIVYKDLSPESERRVYDKWNSGIIQSLDDFINTYKAEIPEFSTIEEELPVSIYGSKEKLKFRFLAITYFVSKDPQFNGYKLINRNQREQFIERLKQITPDDVESIKDTFRILMEVFNPDDFIDFLRLPAFKYHVFAALFHLVANNKVMLGENYVKKRMRTVLGKSAELGTFKNSSIASSIDVYKRCKYRLNYGVERKFV